MEQSPGAYRITGGELNRRRGMLSRLSNQISKLDDQVSGNTQSSFGSRSSSRSTKKYKDTNETKDFSNRDLLQQQQEVVEKQDEHLDNILDGVGKLKNMSYDINAELDLHQGLLEDLGDSVEETDFRLRGSTKRVDMVQEKEASWVPMFCIFLLLGCIIALLFI